MSEPPILGKSRLELNRTIFYVAVAFLYSGLFTGIVMDMKLNDPIVLAFDWMAFGVFTIALILAITRKVSFGAALVICFAQTVFTFLATAIRLHSAYPDHPDSGIANPQFLLLFSLFGIVSGIAVNKFFALIFGSLALVTIVWFATGFKNSVFYQTWFLLDSSVIMGGMFMVFYYRAMLETLVHRLNESLYNVGLLKERAEITHEQNKPFVVFGQNTAGLVNDFQNDVLILDSEIGVLRGDIGTELTAQSLKAMADAVYNLNQRIEWVKYVASASPQRQEEHIDVLKLIESAVYPFTLQKEYQNQVAFSISIGPGIFVEGYRRWFLQAVENLIRNACESGATSIRIRVQLEGKDFPDIGNSVQKAPLSLVLQIEDNGKGDKECHKCPQADCTLCPRLRSQTTLSSSYQMAIRAVEALGGTMEIDGHPEMGTKVLVFLKASNRTSVAENVQSPV